MFVHITEDDKGQPFEVFINLGKAGGSAMADAEAIGRLMSLALRSGISLPALHRQLRGISSDRAVGLGPNKVMSVPDAIGLALEEWMKMKQGVQQELLSSGTSIEAIQPELTLRPEQVKVRSTSDPATGKFHRLATGSAAGGRLYEINSPWGLALSPTNFGGHADQLLVGNFGSGTIMAFEPDGDFRGLLEGRHEEPIVIDGLWGLAFGNGGNAGRPGTLYFTAGPNGEANGLFGALDPVVERKRDRDRDHDHDRD